MLDALFESLVTLSVLGPAVERVRDGACENGDQL